MITVTATARNYSAEMVRNRYVRVNGDGFFWCEVGDNRLYDLRQGRCDASDLTPEIIAAAEKLRGHFPSYVDWPVS